MEKFIMATGTALRISDSGGDGPVMVLLHGYLETLDIWHQFTPLLSPKLRIITLDLPGHGISQIKGKVHTMEFLADVLAGVLDRQGVERCFVAGHSMGGYVAEAFAAQYPQRVEGLILFHSTPNADSEQKRETRRREIELIQSDKLDLVATLFAPKGFSAENRTRLAALIQEHKVQMSMQEPDGVVALINGLIERKDQNKTLQQLKAPQLFIFGRWDEFITQEAAHEIVQHHPQAEIAWLAESGHMGFIEEPQVSAGLLIDFITRHTQGTGS